MLLVIAGKVVGLLKKVQVQLICVIFYCFHPICQLNFVLIFTKGGERGGNGDGDGSSDEDGGDKDDGNGNDGSKVDNPPACGGKDAEMARRQMRQRRQGGGRESCGGGRKSCGGGSGGENEAATQRWQRHKEEADEVRTEA